MPLRFAVIPKWIYQLGDLFIYHGIFVLYCRENAVFLLALLTQKLPMNSLESTLKERLSIQSEIMVRFEALMKVLIDGTVAGQLLMIILCTWCQWGPPNVQNSINQLSQCETSTVRVVGSKNSADGSVTAAENNTDWQIEKWQQNQTGKEHVLAEGTRPGGSSRDFVVRVHYWCAVSRGFESQKNQWWWQEGHSTFTLSWASWVSETPQPRAGINNMEYKPPEAPYQGWYIRELCNWVMLCCYAMNCKLLHQFAIWWSSIWLDP